MPLIFAYGSNMDFIQMRQRCPSASFKCIGKLADYQFTISRFSKKRKCGVADVVKKMGAEVWGVVYCILNADLQSLDEFEGYKSENIARSSYIRKEQPIIPLGNESCSMNAEVYFAVPQLNPPPPSKDYMQLIIDAALYWKLPTEYIDQLTSLKTS